MNRQELEVYLTGYMKDGDKMGEYGPDWSPTREFLEHLIAVAVAATRWSQVPSHGSELDRAADEIERMLDYLAAGG